MMRSLMTGVAAIGILAAISAAGAYVYLQVHGPKNGGLDPIVVATRDISADVAVSGTTEANTDVDLSFKQGGIVDTTPVSVGDAVATGTVLMTLQSEDAQDELAQAKADYAAEEAQLQELRQGTRAESLDVTKAQMQSDTVALQNAEQALAQAITSTQASAENVVHLTIDNYISDANGASPALLVSTGRDPVAGEIVSTRAALTAQIASWDARAATLSSMSETDLLAASGTFDSYLSTIANLIGYFTDIFDRNSTVTSADQAAIAAASTELSSDKSAVAQAEQAVRNASAALDVANNELALAAAGNTNTSIAAGQAAALAAAAKVKQMQDSLNDMQITAPFAGVVSAVNPKSGETVAAGDTAVSLIGNGPIKIEGYVPEVEYGELALGQPVVITLDAFPGETFSGTLASIDPTATLQDGVPNFKITVYFTGDDSRIRPGLTAEASIETAKETSVLAIPETAVHGTESAPMVTRMVGSDAEEVPVTLGAEGSDGWVQIKSGLSAGDTVLIDTTKQYKIVPN